MDPDVTFVPDSGNAVASVPRVAGRYEVGALVGRGGGGQVHRAVDSFTGEVVALKLVRRDGRGTAAQLRRELTALRLVDLPGVARLRDDGEHEGFVFLVLDWLGGGTFARFADQPWEIWREPALGLLEAVGRLHHLGIVHGDLKPANVLLDEAGRPVVTDFGLASGTVVVDHDTRWVAGTPRYMAPEQHQGAVLDARTDLYALGVMFGELDAPPDVQQVFAWMRTEAREGRPASVDPVLDALGLRHRSVADDLAGWTAPVGRATLEALFGSGPTFLHVAEDAATLLLDRGQGDPSSTRAELQRWVRAGLCYRTDDAVVMGRPAVERLQWSQSPAAATVDAALQAHERGDTRRGLVILAALEPTQRVADATVELALSLWSPAAVRQAAYQAERHAWRNAGRVLAAAGALLAGNARLALDTLGHPGTDVGGSQGWALGVGIGAAIREGGVDPWLDAAELWAGDDPDRLGRLAAWRARVAYVRGDFERALDHERDALARSRVPSVRLSRLTTAASAALETDAHADARTWAEQARTLARTLRSGVAEARAWWLLRTIDLRSGALPHPQPAWVRAADEVSIPVGAQLALTEAALAWHGGLKEQAGALATHAMRGLGARPAVADLARALAWRCDASDPPTALSGLDAELDLQTWVLCRQGGWAIGEPPPVPSTRLQGRWLDVLPGDACLDALRGRETR